MNYDDWERNDKLDAEMDRLRRENAGLTICLREMIDAYKTLNSVDRGELCACGQDGCQAVADAWEAMDEATERATDSLRLFLG